MKGSIDKHAFGAGVGRQKSRELVHAACDIRAMARRRCRVNEHGRFRDRLFRPEAE